MNSDPDFKIKYGKSKSIVKKWERDFRERNKRTPTKVDITLANKEVQASYALYWKLKTRMLYESILEDENDGVVSRPKSNDVLRENTNTVNRTSNDHLLCDKTDLAHFKAGVAENNSKAWGVDLNKSKSSSLSIGTVTTLLSSQNLSKKLFGGGKFNKRNPRKSSSFKMKSFKSDISTVSDSQGPCSPMLEGEAESLNVMEDCTPAVKALITSTADISPLFTKKYHIVSENTGVQRRSVSLVQQAVQEPIKDLISKRKLDLEWIDRCEESEVLTDKCRSSDSGFDSINMSNTSLQAHLVKEDTVNEDDDDDEVIGDSDNETMDQSVAKLNFITLSQKRKLEPQTEVAVSEDEDDLALSHIAKKVKLNTSTMGVEALPPLTPITPLPNTILPLTNATNPVLYNLKTTSNILSQSKPTTTIKEDILKNKIQKGTLNENFVKINLKKKVFVRGKKNFNFSKHKKKEWKKKKKGLTAQDDEREVGGVLRCFKCGDVGHFARYCQKMGPDQLLPVGEEEVDEDDDVLPSLEDAKQLARESALGVPFKHTIAHLAVEEDSDEPPGSVASISVTTSVEPLYQLDPSEPMLATPPEVFDTLHKFGLYKFRPGQEAAIMRILCGRSTLLAISTGSGKSLCYQLPAYMYAARSKCITIVVSPLVSLMEDQVSGSSCSLLKLGCLHTNQTPKQREVVLEDVKSGKLCALLVSPEAVVSNDGLFGSCFSSLPPIAFACIDEVHCVSQWSHNFRPSYLMVNKVLREKYGVRTILGLTATASKSTIAGIVRELNIADFEHGVIKDCPLPSNLCLSASVDTDKDRALLALLQGTRFRDASAILVYCTRRDECERLAVLLRTVLRDSTTSASSSRRLSLNAEAYHAGMSSSRRRQVQRAFMAGNLRIVVATVAFGMGINKSDIRGVIHYNMARDMESYVQEVGRAGRDGALAHCHLFLDSKGKDLCELRRHVNSNSVDRHTVRKLLQRVFAPCQCPPDSLCPRHEVAFDCNKTVQALDLPEENIHTLLCYLELHPKDLVKVLAPVYTQCRVQSYHGAKGLITASRKCPPLALACAANKQDALKASITFDVVEVARTISWDSGVVKKQLKNLEWCKTKAGKWKRSGIMVELSGLGFHVAAKGNLSAAELDEVLDYLVGRVSSQGDRAMTQLHATFSTFSHLAVPSYRDCLDSYDSNKSDALKAVIRKYFDTEQLCSSIPFKQIPVEDGGEDVLVGDIRRLICTYRDNSFNGRAIARIMHGIQSPNYPASLWYRCPFWRAHLDKDFNTILSIATKEILKLK